jgi:hypothetical protein
VCALKSRGNRSPVEYAVAWFWAVYLMATHSNGISISAHATAKTARARLLQVRPAAARQAESGPYFAPDRSPLAASLHGKTDGWPSYACAPDVRDVPHVVGAMVAHVRPWGPPRLLQRRDTGARRLSRPAKTASRKLPRRIRLPFQPTPNAFLLAIARPQALI